MIATLDVASIMDEVEQLNDMLLHSEQAREYHQSKWFLTQNKQAQQLIKDFTGKKEQFEEVERFGKYHPDHDRIKKEMRQIKRDLDMNEHIARYKKAERELDKMLAEVSQIVAFSVSETIKVPTGNAFFDEASLGGGCGTGSGGCSGGCSSCGN